MNKNNKEILMSEKDEIIFNGALNVFIKKGFDNATIDEIVNESKVGKGTIYRRIGNKEKLEKFIMKQMGTLMFGKIKKKIQKNNNPLLQFKEIVNIMCDFFDDKPQVAMLFYSRMFFNSKKPNNTTSWPPIDGLKTDNLVENIIKNAIKKKQIKEVNEIVFLRGFTCFCNPFYYHFLKENMGLSKSEISVWIIDTLLHGVAIKNN